MCYRFLKRSLIIGQKPRHAEPSAGLNDVYKETPRQTVPFLRSMCNRQTSTKILER